jgi:hypothetical protein
MIYRKDTHPGVMTTDFSGQTPGFVKYQNPVSFLLPVADGDLMKNISGST